VAFIGIHIVKPYEAISYCYKNCFAVILIIYSVYWLGKEMGGIIYQLVWLQHQPQAKNVTPYMHLLIYHVPDHICFYGNINMFSCQGENSKLVCEQHEVQYLLLKPLKRMTFVRQHISRHQTSGRHCGHWTKEKQSVTLFKKKKKLHIR